MVTQDTKGDLAPVEFKHPAFGRCVRDPSRAAVRWRGNVNPTSKERLLDSVGLIYARLDANTDRPLLQVNQTDGLSWVQNPNEAPLTSDQLRALERSELVEWVASAYRADRSDPTVPALFAVNPSRLYIRRDDLDATEGIPALRTATAVDADAPERIHGYQTLRVEVPTDGSAIDIAAALTSEVAARRGESGLTPVRLENIPYLSPTVHVMTPPSMPAVGALTPAVEHCRPPSSEFTPNDPQFGTQWGLQRINAPRGWEIMRGSPNITVAVIDEGVELAHPDLDLHPQSWNASTDTPNGGPTGAHGTACAGIIGARLDNTVGVAGVAGGVRTMAIATATWADVDIVEGLYFAADNGARVVSMSFGVYPSWMIWDFDIVRDALQYAHDHGLVLVAASGNENIAQSRFPGSDARTLTVGGSNRSDERKRIGDASNEAWWGACYGDDLDVVAPCLEIPTTDRFGTAGYSMGDYFDRFNGTSAATPHVAGLAALILSMRPQLTNVQVRSLIETTCDKISPATYAYATVAHKTSGTWNAEVGYGRINVERALLAACALVGNGAQDECSGCGGTCIEEIPADCRGPEPVPWLAHDRCMFFYETRLFDQQRLQIRVTYEHCLRLLGRQQGGLLYTQTLLPSEEVRLFYFDRYRRIRSQTERLSVHSSFRQTLSALSESRRATSASAYTDTLSKTRSESDMSISVGGGLAGFFGAPSGSFDRSTETETTVASGASVRAVSEQFSRFAATASQVLEAERSIVISSFEEQENQATTQRTFTNHNHCYAVTYYIRRVNELYESTSRVVAVDWRVSADTPFRSTRDLAGVPNDLQKRLQDVLRDAPRVGESVTDRRHITIPTDGTLYETELAHCSSCEPMREAEMRIDIERRRLETRRICLETEALSLEVERRRALLAGQSSLALLGAGATGALPPISATGTLPPISATAPPALAAPGSSPSSPGH